MPSDRNDAATFGEIDDIGFLREAELFRDMDEAELRTILLQAETKTYRAGELVVRRGEAGDRLFVVKSGVVEVVSPVEDGDAATLEFLGRGECFGELALLRGSTRSADIRVPEKAELLVIDRPLFEDLMANQTGFAWRLAAILAERLEKLLQKLPEIARGAGPVPDTAGRRKELEGSLRYFDLATVIQTLISSGQTGHMRLLASGRTVAELVFHGGNIFRAFYDQRTGDEAIHQLFQRQPDGEFHFTGSEPGELGVEPDPGITVPAMALMMESVRLQDELSPLEQQLPDEAVLLERTADALEWTEPSGHREAAFLWERLRNPLPVGDLLDGSPACRYHTARVLLRLLETEQVLPALHTGP